jgi:uncharacterized protein YneF (UPF0154 family)
MTQQVGFIDRMKRGWNVVETGWGFIKDNPSCLIFPLISAVTKAAFVLTILVSYVFFLVKQLMQYVKAHPHATKAMMKVELKQIIPPLSGTLLMLLFLFICFLISSIMYTALSFYMAQKIEGQPASLGASLGRAFSRFGPLCLWSLINTLLAFLLKVIRKFARGNKFPFNLIVSFIAGSLRFAWKVLTFFVIPIFALKDLGMIATIEESGNTMKKMWGESIGANFNIGLIAFASFFILVLAGCLPIYLFSGTVFHADLVTFYTLALIVIGIFLSLLFSTATTLFQTAAYLHSQGKSSGPFQAEFIQTSFETKPSKS